MQQPPILKSFFIKITTLFSTSSRSRPAVMASIAEVPGASDDMSTTSTSSTVRETPAEERSVSRDTFGVVVPSSPIIFDQASRDEAESPIDPALMRQHASISVSSLQYEGLPAPTAAEPFIHRRQPSLPRSWQEMFLESPSVTTIFQTPTDNECDGPEPRVICRLTAWSQFWFRKRMDNVLMYQYFAPNTDGTECVDIVV